MRILKGEVDLRDITRVTEQTRATVLPHEHEQSAMKLNKTQSGLRERTQIVIDKLEELQATQNKNYDKPLGKLAKAESAMRDAADLLAAAESGPPTIAAETEAIDALMVTKRGGGGGGGGGSAPGGGTGGGEANDASALAGIGDDLQAEDRFVEQSTGMTRSQIPDEFRAGLDAYFNAIEGG